MALILSIGFWGMFYYSYSCTRTSRTTLVIWFRGICYYNYSWNYKGNLAANIGKFLGPPYYSADCQLCLGARVEVQGLGFRV